MKRNKFIKWAMPTVMAFFLGSCIPDSLNVDPNSSSDLNPNLQIGTIQLLQSNDAEAWHRYFIYPGGYMNQWTNDWAVVNYGGTAVKSDSYFSQLWLSTYPTIINEIVDVEERTRNVDAYTNVHAAVKVLKVENFLRLTDYYGDIPYSEAGKAFFQNILKPKYDKQEDIYNDFFVQLDEAVKLFDVTKPRLSTDLYYDGNVEKWVKFANSLRLRIAMRLVKVAPQKAAEQVAIAVQGGVFTSNDDICFIKHQNIQTTELSGGNGLANRLLTDNKSSTFRMTKELIGSMEDTQDPRLRVIAGSYLEDATRFEITDQLHEAYGSYKPIALGAQHFSWEQGVAPPTNPIKLKDRNGEEVSVPALIQFLQPSKLITNPGSPFIHMSYAEVEFLLAEAAHHKYIGGTAQEHYNKGLRAAIEQWKTVFGATIEETKIATFVSANALVSGKELEQINTQLWVLHILDPFETWANWRRSGFPDIKFYNYRPSENQSGGQTPRRIQYPLSEQGVNLANYREAINRMGGTDSWTNRVWWDKDVK